MGHELGVDAYAVLLPAIGGLVLEDWARAYFDAGGRTLLLGESRAEYVGRAMTDERERAESAEAFRRATDEAGRLAGAPVMVAVDQELGGIGRLHSLVPRLPTAGEARGMGTAELTAASAETAAAAKGLGVSMFLAPILDVVTGPNPWLAGRTLGQDPDEVARIGTAYVRGVQEAGVAATAKHFPGYRELAEDPAEVDTTLQGDRAELEAGLTPFRAVIEAGVGAVMTGPAAVAALDPDESASTSATVIRLLRHELGFAGLVVSDDLDAPAISKGRTVADTAIRSLAAGADLLLLAGGPQVPAIAAAIARAAEDGVLDADRLHRSAEHVRGLAG